MARTYKMEYVNKVKAKFNDAQPAKSTVNNAPAKPCDDKNRKERKAIGVVKQGD